MKTLFTLSTLAFPIALAKDGGRYVVAYGRQLKKGLTYDQAALELGAAIMHALACDGQLVDNKDAPRVHGLAAINAACYRGK